MWTGEQVRDKEESRRSEGLRFSPAALFIGSSVLQWRGPGVI
jgi:hypothetical protein